MGWRPQPRYDKSRNSWYCRYRNKKHYLGTEYIEACERFARVVGQEAVGEAPQTVAEAISSWLLLHDQKRWDWWILKTWAEYAGREPLHRIIPDHLQAYLSHLKGQAQSSATIRHKVRKAAEVCRWCVKHGYMHAVPEMPKLPKPMQRPRDVPHQKLREVFATLPRKTEPILRFILEVGCRPSEACQLEWSEVDLEHDVCILSQHKSSSTGRPRTLYLTPAARHILDSLPRRDGHVFLNRLHKHFTPSGLRSVLRRRGINSVYSLRHTRAQAMLDSGVPIEDVAKLLGHRDLSIVQTYAQVRDERARVVASNLSSPLHVETRIEY